MADRKTALVTGGSRGIGMGISLELAARGWDVALTYRDNEDGAKATAARVSEAGGKCRIYRANMEDLSVPAPLVDGVRADFGRLDALVCNAARDRRYSVMTATPEALARDTAQLYSAQMLLAGAAARHFVRDGVRGGIVFITSVHGRMPTATDFLYGGMKAALERGCKSLALELAPYRIRVNCVAPGAINVRHVDDSQLKYPYADMVPLGRRGTEEDIAWAVEFLLSDRAAYITGQTLTVDGGFALPGVPEGYAQAYPIDMGFIRRTYDEIMKKGEE